MSKQRRIKSDILNFKEKESLFKNDFAFFADEISTPEILYKHKLLEEDIKEKEAVASFIFSRPIVFDKKEQLLLSYKNGNQSTDYSLLVLESKDLNGVKTVKNKLSKIDEKKQAEKLLFKKVQKVFEYGLVKEYLKIKIEKRAEISSRGDELVNKIIIACASAKDLIRDERVKIGKVIKMYIWEWLNFFKLPTHFVQSEVESRFVKIAAFFDLPLGEINSQLSNKPENEKTALFEVVAVDRQSSPVIALKNVDVKYNFGKPTEYYAIKNASIDIYAGELVIFFGPSGCGKSTLVNVIAGLERPVNGSVEVLSKDILQFNYDQMADYHADTIGFVFQAYNLIESLSVEDNIIFPQMFRDASRSDRRKRANELLHRFEIDAHAKKSPVMLSGGQQQRVGIARALINDPSIVLADEPMGNLDTASADIVVDIFRNLSKEENKTVILVTHNPELLSIANRVIYMKDGAIIREEINNDVRPAEVRQKKEKELADNNEKIPAELKNLLKIYGGVSASQLSSMWIPLKAKMITDQILQKYSREQISFIEEVVKRRLMGVVSRQEVFDLIDLPVDSGGAGLDKRAAGAMADKIEIILTEADKIKKYISNQIDNMQDDIVAEKDLVVEIRKELLINYKGHLIQKNIDNLDGFIKMRLENAIDNASFILGVSKPLSLNGAGFDRRTAKKIARELELLMLIKFGEESEASLLKK